jgi:hypothetical protein
MTLLCVQCMNRLHEVHVPGECLARGRIIGLSQAAHILLLCIEIREQRPSQIVLQVTPDLLNRIQLWTVGQEPQGADLLRPTHAVGGVRAAVIQEQDVEAVGNAWANASTKMWQLSACRYGSSRKKRSPVAGATAP